MSWASDSLAVFLRSHQEIVSSLAQVMMMARSYAQALGRLQEMDERLLAYFSRQDDHFYKKLIDHYSSDREHSKIIESLIHDLKDTKIQYLIFTEKYTIDKTYRAPSGNFPKDLMDFKEVVINRLKLEEEYLFPLLKEIPDRPD